MEIKNSDITVFYINPSKHKDRTVSIENTINKLNVKKSYRIDFDFDGQRVIQNIASNHICALQKAISRDIFPVLILEDDAILETEFVIPPNIPDNADMIYFGGSLFNAQEKHEKLYFTRYNKDYYRVHYMLSCHALLFLNKEGAKKIIDILRFSIAKNTYCDVEIANKSEDLLLLAPRKGFCFYQSGRGETITKFNIKNFIK